METNKLAAAALANKTETSGIPNDTTSQAAATLQTTSSQATSSNPVGHFNLVA